MKNEDLSIKQKLARLLESDDADPETAQNADLDESDLDDIYLFFDNAMWGEPSFEDFLTFGCGLITEDVDTITDVTTALRDNGIANPTDFKKLFGSDHPYNENDIGCSLERPFIINNTENYVHLEYCIVHAIITCRHHPFQSKFVLQELHNLKDRKIDRLTIHITDRPQSTDPYIEKYHFDITAGYDALSRFF